MKRQAHKNGEANAPLRVETVPEPVQETPLQTANTSGSTVKEFFTKNKNYISNVLSTNLEQAKKQISAQENPKMMNSERDGDEHINAPSPLKIR